jgi:aryl-alcohol dehydrogenase-like predicted oxidoreductase
LWALKDFPGEAPAGRSYDTPENRTRLLQAIQVAGERDVTANQIALAFLLHQPFPVTPIIGTHQVEHVREAMGALDIRLTPEEMDRLI